MLKVSIAMFMSFILISSPIYAGKTIHLSPKESKQLTNPFLWTLKAKCNIQGGQSKNKILVSVTKSQGQVNGKKLSKGQATSVSVKGNDSISVSADAGASINLVNLGSDSVQAVCYT